MLLVQKQFGRLAIQASCKRVFQTFAFLCEKDCEEVTTAS